MSGIAIMTDSNSGIMPSEGADYGIHVLPMPVIIDGKTYFEGIDITPDEFYEKQTAGAVITTSQPSPGDVTAMWDELLREYDEILFIPMSSGLSNTCQTAALLAEEEPYTGRVFVVDNHRISVTQAMSVLDAATLAAQGISGLGIKETLEKEALDATIYPAPKPSARRLSSDPSPIGRLAASADGRRRRQQPQEPGQQRRGQQQAQRQKDQSPQPQNQQKPSQGGARRLHRRG